MSNVFVGGAAWGGGLGVGLQEGVPEWVFPLGSYWLLTRGRGFDLPKGTKYFVGQVCSPKLLDFPPSLESEEKVKLEPKSHPKTMRPAKY